jgi:hypothetical protein
MRFGPLALLLLIGCVIETEPHPKDPDPAVCPAEPYVVCGYRDGGWDVYCAGGIIYEASFNGAMYCLPPSSEVVCESTDPTPRAKSSCTSGCKNGEHKYLETISEYSAFDSSTLCLP